MQPPTGGGAPEMVGDRRHLSMSQWMNSSVTDATPAKISGVSLETFTEDGHGTQAALFRYFLLATSNDSKYPQCRFSGVSPENTQAANEETPQKI